MILVANKDSKKSCWFFHAWDTEKDTVITQYQVCLKCGSKRILQLPGCYQPVDLDYLGES